MCSDEATVRGGVLRGWASVDEGRLVRGLLPDVGTMVDVGAHNGESSLGLWRRGWSVHAFEPHPDRRAHIQAIVGPDPFYHLNAEAIARQDGGTVPLFTSPVSTGITTLTPFHPSHRATHMAHTIRLDTYLRTRGVTSVDFLKVDSEGHDLFVLQTFPWDAMSPVAVMCEFEDRKTRPLGYGTGDLIALLRDHGMTVIVSEWHPVTEYGIRHHWRRFSIAEAPDQVPSADSWGNLIALRGVDRSRISRSIASEALAARSFRPLVALGRRLVRRPAGVLRDALRRPTQR